MKQQREHTVWKKPNLTLHSDFELALGQFILISSSTKQIGGQVNLFSRITKQP
jgi:hypothetical protein